MARTANGRMLRRACSSAARPILVMVGLTVLYLADLIFTLNYTVGQRQGEYLNSRYYGIMPDFVYITVIGCLSVAVLFYPAAPPVFAADLARGDASSIP